MFRTSRTLLAALFAALLLTHQAISGAAETAAVRDSDVRVEHTGEGITVDVNMQAPVSQAIAWAVLTDFEHMAEFVPNLKSSQILARGEGTLRVHQKGTARYGIFSTDFDSIREIALSPPREIRAHGVGGNIKKMESVMRLETDGEVTRMKYHAEVWPDFWLPPLLGPSFVRHETAEQFSALIAEMLRRR